MRTASVCLAVICLLPQLCLAASPAKVDPQTKKIRTLFIGDPYLKPGYPTMAFLEDPKIHLTRIEAEIGYQNPSWGRAEMERWLRLYLPRTESDLLDNYDVLIITAIRSDDLKYEFQVWARTAVEEQGFGLLMSDDPTSFGGALTVWTTGPPWDDTPVGSVLPVYQIGHDEWRDHNFRILPVISNPITDGIDFKRMPRIWSHNRPKPKDGATVLAVTTDETVASDPKNDPVLIYWDIGQGRTLGFIWDWGGNGVVGFYHWDYWKDFIARLAYFVARATIPADVAITHTLRSQISEYALEKDTLFSLIDFADTFGANTHTLNQELANTENLRKRVDELWIDEQFGDCLPAMEEALSSLTRVMGDAVKAKDRALIWVYIIEWLTVAGTSIVVGVAVWLLMIRRKLYREVRTTRFES